MKMQRIIPAAIIVAIIGGGTWFGIAHKSSTATPAPTPTATISATAGASIVSYKGQDGKNAMEILKATHTVAVKTYSFGDMVQSIDGLASDSTTYWAFYVNGKSSDVGAGDYNTASTDTLEWRLEKQ